MMRQNGNDLTGMFCPRCGSPLVDKNESTDLISLTCRSCGYEEKRLKRLT